MAEPAKKADEHASDKSKPTSKGGKRYGHPPKIGEKSAIGKGQGEPVSKTEPTTKNPGSAPKSDVMDGTDGIAVRHGAERDEMTKRHAKEVHQLHSRHATEHESMIKKHAKDFGTIGGFPGDGGGGGGMGGGMGGGGV